MRHHSAIFTFIQLAIPEVEGPLYIDGSVLSLLSLPTLLRRTDAPLLSTGASRPFESGLCSSSVGQRHLRECRLRQAGSVSDWFGGNSPYFHPGSSYIVLGAHCGYYIPSGPHRRGGNLLASVRRPVSWIWAHVLPGDQMT